MPYLIKFHGLTYYDGFKRETRPIPEDGIYEVIGNGKNREIKHLLREGEDLRNRISIHKRHFEVIRKA